MSDCPLEGWRLQLHLGLLQELRVVVAVLPPGGQTSHRSFISSNNIPELSPHPGQPAEQGPPQQDVDPGVQDRVHGGDPDRSQVGIRVLIPHEAGEQTDLQDNHTREYERSSGIGAEQARTTTEVVTSTAIICVSAAEDRALQRCRTLALPRGRRAVRLRMSSSAPHTARFSTMVPRMRSRLPAPYSAEYAAATGARPRSMKHHVADGCSALRDMPMAGRPQNSAWLR
ncbi:hypothetical protein EYF80_041880 [Liparis tanakae]|uniref:Uncharacterized protein n=1 Tax=Liparis tanakae TaxID=230148 RepID=A0A4Z2G315_9TELE|nr:hypothetical protein EYF80_041880 [Liparis tanakae]